MLCFIFILTIDIRINSIPLPAAQQTPKQIPLMVYETPIQGTYTESTFSNCQDSPSPMAVLHSNYSMLAQKTKDKRYKTSL